MKGLFTITFLLLLTFSLAAQKDVSRAMTVEARSSADVQMVHSEELSNRFEIVNDTIFPSIFGADDCSSSDNWTIYNSSDDNGVTAGFLSGNNLFGDLEKGELLGLAGVASMKVSALYMIPLIGLTDQDSEIQAKIYAYDSETQLPGDLLGTSESIDIANLTDLGDNFFNFSPTIEITGDRFFAVFDFSDTYSDTGLKDTIGILSTQIGCGDLTSSVEKWNDDSWNTIPAAWQLTGGLNMLIGAAIEYDDATAGFVTPGRNGVELMPAFPNPATQNITMAFSLKNASDAMFKVVDALGREVANEHIGLRQEGIHTHSLDISAFSSGIYFYSLHTDKAILSGSFNKK